MSLFTSRTRKRFEQLDSGLAQTRTELHGALADIAKSVQALHEMQLPTFERLIALAAAQGEDAATIEVLREELDSANSLARELTGKLDQTQRSNASLINQHTTMRRALDQVINAFTRTPKDNALQETARAITANAEVLGLPPGQRKAVDELANQVCIVLSFGDIRSVHRSMDDATKAHRSVVDWAAKERLTDVRDILNLGRAAMLLPVRGDWPDPTRVYLVLDRDGVPLSAHGFEPKLTNILHSVTRFDVAAPAAAA